MVAVICINAVWNKQSYLNNGLFSEQNVGVEQFVTYFYFQALHTLFILINSQSRSNL